MSKRSGSLAGETLVSNRHQLLAHAGQAAQFKLLRQTPFVDGFDQAGAFVPMPLDGCADVVFGQPGCFLKQRMHGEWVNRRIGTGGNGGNSDFLHGRCCLCLLLLNHFSFPLRPRIRDSPHRSICQILLFLDFFRVFSFVNSWAARASRPRGSQTNHAITACSRSCPVRSCHRC